jgi:gliding motility-associated-like protein
MIDSSTNQYNVGTLTVGNFGGQCSSTDTFTIEIAPLPAATAFIKQEICKGDTVGLTLTSRSYNALHFFWYVDEVPLANSSVVNTITAYIDDQGPFSVSFNDTGLHVIKLLCNTSLGCMSSPFYDTVRVHQVPNASFVVSPLSSGKLCIEDSMLFRANDVSPEFSYLWEPKHYFSNDNRYYIYGKVEQARSLVKLTITDPFGCKSSNIEEIDPQTCCTVAFPSAFTPNNDGKNDYFHPLFAGFHRFHQFRVVNRWGETVFSSSDSDPKWDGFFNGVPQDMGVYYYYIKYDCGGETHEQKGECTLVR